MCFDKHDLRVMESYQNNFNLSKHCKLIFQAIAIFTNLPIFAEYNVQALQNIIHRHQDILKTLQFATYTV